MVNSKVPPPTQFNLAVVKVAEGEVAVPGVEAWLGVVGQGSVTASVTWKPSIGAAAAEAAGVTVTPNTGT